MGGAGLLQKMGFRVNPNRKLCKSLQSVAAYYEHWNTARLNLPYMTDGVVVKLNSFALQQVGFTQSFLAGLWRLSTEEAPHALKTSL